MSAEKYTKVKFGLTAKICLVIALVSISVTLLVSYLNYKNYLDAVYEVHETYSMQNSQLLEDCLSKEEWIELREIIKQFENYEISEEELLEYEASSAYQEKYSRLQRMVDQMDVTNVAVFLVDFDWMEEIDRENFDPEDSEVLTFLMDFYPTGTDQITYEFGDCSSWWEDYDGYLTYADIFELLRQQGEDDSMREVLNDTDLILTNYHPIMDGEQLVAVMLISGNAIKIEDFMQSFFIRNLLIGLGITVLFILLAIIFFYWRLVKPLQLIRSEAADFIKNQTKVSERLHTIHTKDEIQQVAESVLQMEKDLNAYVERVEQVTAEKERISTELNVATKIQEDMLPTVFPPFPDRPEFSVYASMDPAREVGGDFYDFFFVDQNHLALVIADVAGKGVPAAMFMVIAKSLLKNRAQMGGTPAEILRDVNNQLCEGNEQDMFVTVWIAIIDLQTGQGVAANAGHEHPARKDKGNKYELLKYRHSLAVAAMEDLKFREHSFEMKPGDRLFVYTDGLPEAINGQGEAYGTERIIQILNEMEDAPLQAQLDRITADVAEFVKEEPQFDDLTMLAFEYHGPAESE